MVDFLIVRQVNSFAAIEFDKDSDRILLNDISVQTFSL